MTTQANRWTLEFRDTGGYDCMTGAWIISDENRTIAVVDQADYGQDHCDWEWKSAEAEAIARLIVAAPELLSTLKRMTAWAGGVDAQRLPPPWPELVAIARAAIAQAEGRE